MAPGDRLRDPVAATQAQPSAGDVAELVDQVRVRGPRLCSPRGGVSQRLEQALAREAGVEVGEPL